MSSLDGVYLAEEHPVDEALGCMVPIALAIAGLLFFLTKLIAF